jgi:adenylate kinase family enzyme
MTSRILVLGCPGAGKTTLAKELAARAGLPLYHLDDEYWGAGWARPTPESWVARQRELAELPEWVIDGNYLAGIPVRAQRAELVVVLDVPTYVCLFRLLRRTWRILRHDRSALPASVRRSASARATGDFPALLRKVALFRTRDFWPVVQAAHTNPDARVFVAVGRSRAVPRVAAGCRARGLRTRVLALQAERLWQLFTVDDRQS